MKSLVVTLILMIAVPFAATAHQEVSADKNFGESVLSFFVETIPGAAVAVGRKAVVGTVVAGVAVGHAASTAYTATKNVIVDTSVAVCDTVSEVTKPLFW